MKMKMKKTTLVALSSIILGLLFFCGMFLPRSLSDGVKDFEVQNAGVSSILEVDKVKSDTSYPARAKENLLTDINGNPIPSKTIAETEVSVITKNKPSYIKNSDRTYILMYFNKNEMCVGDWVDPLYTAYGGMSKDLCIKKMKEHYKKEAIEQNKNIQIVNRDIEIRNAIEKNNQIWIIDKYISKCSPHPEWESELAKDYPNVFIDEFKCKTSLNMYMQKLEDIRNTRNIYSNIALTFLILSVCFLIIGFSIFIVKAIKYIWVNFVALTAEAISKGKSKSKN